MNIKNKQRHLIIFLMLHLAVFSMYNMGHPVTPQYIKDLNAPAYMTGVLLGIMALSQFFFAPFWGQVSDVVGRKIAFIGPFGYAFGQLGFVFLDNPLWLLVFRFISGAFSVVSLTVHFAYISDQVSGEKRTKYLGIAALLMPIGIFVGYTTGGFLGDLVGPRMTFLYQAVISFIIAIILYFYIKEFRINDKGLKDIKWNVIKENRNILRRNSDTILKFILLITFLNIVSFQLTLSQTAVILNNGFDKTMSYIGLFVALLNLFAGLVSFYIQPRIFKHEKSNASFLPYLSMFSVIAAMTSAFSSLANPTTMWIGLMITTLLNTIFIAIVQDVITKLDKHDEKGSLLGINQAIQALGIFVGTTSAGFLLTKGLFMPMLIGTFMFALTAIINRLIIRNKSVS